MSPKILVTRGTSDCAVRTDRGGATLYRLSWLSVLVGLGEGPECLKNFTRECQVLLTNRVGRQTDRILGHPSPAHAGAYTQSRTAGLASAHTTATIQPRERSAPIMAPGLPADGLQHRSGLDAVQRDARQCSTQPPTQTQSAQRGAARRGRTQRGREMLSQHALGGHRDTIAVPRPRRRVWLLSIGSVNNPSAEGESRTR